MKPLSLLATCVLAAGLTLPSAVVAQQTAPPPASSASSTHARHWRRMHRRLFKGITLTADQRTRMRQLRAQYRQAHPVGSPRDPAASKQLLQAMLAILTPAQRTQYEANRARMRAHHRARPSSAANGPFAPSPIATPSSRPSPAP